VSVPAQPALPNALMYSLPQMQNSPAQPVVAPMFDVQAAAVS
jgi:hypothetical protein